nr:DnaJ domain-containing protein [Halarcobacter sp.]
MVLGISENATKDEIKKAYRILMKKYHTDVTQEKYPEKFELYTEITKHINNAYSKLK